jgi:hypothetical protein
VVTFKKTTDARGAAGKKLLIAKGAKEGLAEDAKRNREGWLVLSGSEIRSLR